MNLSLPQSFLISCLSLGAGCDSYVCEDLRRGLNSTLLAHTNDTVKRHEIDRQEGDAIQRLRTITREHGENLRGQVDETTLRHVAQLARDRISQDQTAPTDVSHRTWGILGLALLLTGTYLAQRNLKNHSQSLKMGVWLGGLFVGGIFFWHSFHGPRGRSYRPLNDGVCGKMVSHHQPPRRIESTGSDTRLSPTIPTENSRESDRDTAIPHTLSDVVESLVGSICTEIAACSQGLFSPDLCETTLRNSTAIPQRFGLVTSPTLNSMPQRGPAGIQINEPALQRCLTRIAENGSSCGINRHELGFPSAEELRTNAGTYYLGLTDLLLDDACREVFSGEISIPASVRTPWVRGLVTALCTHRARCLPRLPLGDCVQSALSNTGFLEGSGEPFSLQVIDDTLNPDRFGTGPREYGRCLTALQNQSCDDPIAPNGPPPEPCREVFTRIYRDPLPDNPPVDESSF